MPLAPPAKHVHTAYMKKIKIALLQMRVCMDKEVNLRKCEEWLAAAKAEGADAAVLPELFTMPFDPGPLLAAAEDFESGETAGRVRSAAAKHGLVIIAGSFPEAVREGCAIHGAAHMSASGSKMRAGDADASGGKLRDRVYNTSFAVGVGGEILAKYRKGHLFDPKYAGVTLRESDCMLPGSDLAFFDCLGHSAALAICYDLRFPAFFGSLARGGVKLVFVPAAFNHISGPAHWELLVRARALDGQFFVAACAPAPNADLKYNPYGHSLVADPWGKVLLDGVEGEGIFSCEVDPSRADEVRTQLPLAEQARPDVY